MCWMTRRALVHFVRPSAQLAMQSFRLAADGGQPQACLKLADRMYTSSAATSSPSHARVGTEGQCSPRQRMPLKSRNKGSKCAREETHA